MITMRERGVSVMFVKQHIGYRTKMFFLSFAFLISVMSVSASAAPIVLKFAGQNPPDHIATNAMREIAAEVSDKTQGRVEIRVFPSNQLGDYTLVYEELIRGTIELAAISFPSQFDNRMDLIYAHGYTSSYEQVAKVYDPGGWFFKKMDEFNTRLGVKLLGLYLEGMVGIGTVKPMRDPLSPKGDKGLLLRIPNMDVFKTALEGVGIRTISIPFADVYQSMQTGVCDGDTGYSIVAAYTALGDVVKHWYNFNKNTECLGIMISNKAWEKLSDEDKKTLQSAVSRQTSKSVADARKNDEKHLKLMKDRGIVVHTFTTAELEPLMKSFRESWGKLNESKGKGLMDEFKKEMDKVSAAVSEK